MNDLRRAAGGERVVIDQPGGVAAHGDEDALCAVGEHVVIDAEGRISGVPAALTSPSLSAPTPVNPNPVTRVVVALCIGDG